MDHGKTPPAPFSDADTACAIGAAQFSSFRCSLGDVFRQACVCGIIAVGMTIVVFIAGVDPLVGHFTVLRTVTYATLLTQ